MKRYRLKQAFISIHRWVGLTAGLALVLIGLTGSVSVYWRELHELTDSRLRVATPHAKGYRPYAEIVAALNDAFPGREDAWALYPPWNSRGVMYAVYEFPEERADAYESPLYVAIDPYRAQVTSHYYWGESPVSWIYNLHSHLHAGPAGMGIVGALGIFLLLLALSGVYVWWPVGRFVKRLFVPEHRQGAARLEFDLHRVGGIYLWVLLFVLSLSGILIVFEPQMSKAVGAAESPPAPLSAPRSGALPISADEAVARARRLFPDATLKALHVPGGRRVAYQVNLRQPGETFDRFYPNTNVWIDQYSGEVLRVEDPRQFDAGRRFMNLRVPFHGGEALGAWGRVLTCLTGFVPLLMFYTGIRQWLRARRSVSSRA